jgi:mono/diheme cytochrome c family protein
MKSVLWAILAAPRAMAQDSAVTWSHQIAPLVYNNCTTCHHPGGAGPFSLLNYEDARRWGQAMSAVTASRYMPPWLPEPGYGDFSDPRRLSDEKIALIARWVKAAMPRRR